ncbi:MAG: hypothetical protein QOE70_2392 [Chthoniobacter sp.]|jgi:uncharacterized protein YbaR (Trm112 family)|nr:hypothetical protein [Chthoniobacter sp.]
MPPELLAILRCPLTRQPLYLASPEQLAHLSTVLAAALIREDGRVVYPIRDGIPMLLPEEAITIPRPEA